MPAYKNHTKQQLLSGKIAIGMGLYLARTIDIAAVAKTSGYDWLFIDMEHSALDVGTAGQIAAAALPVGITPIVRVPGKEHHHAARLLDAGAQGIVVPHVDSVEEAKRAVAYCKYPPIGHRSIMGVQPMLQFAGVPVAEGAKIMNEEILVILMLETPGAIAQADAIAALPGVDVVMIGTNDLCAEMNIHGQYGDPKIEAAYKSVIAACHKHGKIPGMGGVVDHALLEKYIGMGMRFILSGLDLVFLMRGARERSEFLHGLKL
ncbi:MAG TPA: aldolase/citrate lyase family protein [Burkholderiales bacterium]|nr:aldolase/citrate lyase family protein [Burkholderiales bacterium]